MKNRLSVAAVLLVSGLLGTARADVTLEPKQPFAPADRAMTDALSKPSEDAPITPELKVHIRTVAEHMVFPLTPQNKDPKKKDILETPNELTAHLRRVEQMFRTVLGADDVKNKDAQKEFVEAMQTALGEVLGEKNEPNITKVNAARVAARLAFHGRREETADLLIKVLADPNQVDGARYYACQGLKDLFARIAQRADPAMKNAPIIKDEKRQAAVVKALVSFVERALPFRPNTTEEVEGLRVVRREAIRALAELRVAGVEGAGGHAALALCRIAGDAAGLILPARHDEQVEAAVGLCRLPMDAKKDYQPGYAAYHVGRVAYQLAQGYKDPPGPTVAERKEPYRVQAARLRDALIQMKSLHPEDGVVVSVFTAASKVLQDVEDTSDSKRSMVNPEPLRKYLEETQLPVKSIYKSDEASTVTPRAKGPMEK